MRNHTLDGEANSAVNASPLPSPNLQRRGFLLALSAGGAGAAAAAASAVPGVALANPSATASATAGQDAGYRETELIRDYYRTARI